MHGHVLPKGSRDLLAEIEKCTPKALRGWTLAGGTGLALHLGHRLSEGLDFFRLTRMERPGLYEALQRFGNCETLQQEARTFTVLVRGIKISFFQIREPFLFPTVPFSFFRVADVKDIAPMKLAAIADRGSRKDFFDLYAILRRGQDLRACFSFLDEKYGKGRLNDYQILKSLTYFDDAEKEPLPRMLEPFDWKECKAFFLREAHGMVLPPRDG